MSIPGERRTPLRSWAVISAGALFGIAERGLDLYQQARGEGDHADAGAQLLGGAVAGAIFGIAASRLLRRINLIS